MFQPTVGTVHSPNYSLSTYTMTAPRPTVVDCRCSTRRQLLQLNQCSRSGGTGRVYNSVRSCSSQAEASLFHWSGCSAQAHRSLSRSGLLRRQLGTNTVCFPSSTSGVGLLQSVVASPTLECPLGVAPPPSVQYNSIECCSVVCRRLNEAARCLGCRDATTYRVETLDNRSDYLTNVLSRRDASRWCGRREVQPSCCLTRCSTPIILSRHEGRSHRIRTRTKTGWVEGREPAGRPAARIGDDAFRPDVPRKRGREPMLHTAATVCRTLNERWTYLTHIGIVLKVFEQADVRSVLYIVHCSSV